MILSTVFALLIILYGGGKSVVYRFDFDCFLSLCLSGFYQLWGVLLLKAGRLATMRLNVIILCGVIDTAPNAICGFIHVYGLH